ncbi:MAG TPA: DUF4231 domain-containing protein [Chitinophagaceae bacterium]|nr:DUF4231 domain-containing protein [Chitinophagaceae bacterium]
MDKATFDTYLQERYNDQMTYYSNAAGKNQKKYRRFQWILIILSALTPVLAALSGRPITLGGVVHNWDLQIFVVLISAIVAILTTGLKTFNYQELWITYRTTYEKLKPEIYYYNFSIGPYSGSEVDKESLFVTRIEAMLDAEHNQWPAATKQQNDQGKAGANGLTTSSASRQGSNEMQENGGDNRS